MLLLLLKYIYVIEKIVLYDNKCDITLWTAFNDEKEMLEKERCNKNRLPDFYIPNNIKITTSLKDAIKDKELIISVPASAIDDVSLKLKDIINKNQHICIASKGIEQDTCLFVCDVVNKYIKTNKISVISGPSFAVDIIKKVN